MITINHFRRSNWPYIVTIWTGHSRVAFHWHCTNSKPIAFFIYHRGTSNWLVHEDYQVCFKRKHKGVPFTVCDHATFNQRRRFAIRLVAFNDA